MCGIIGYFGDSSAQNAVKLLKKLEYRGYDSAGVATSDGKSLHALKSVGKIRVLEQKLSLSPLDGSFAIAHTRWATHGKVSETNAHPIMHGDKWAVVHNGIIDNYAAIKGGEKFVSQTDTEAIAFLLERGEGLTAVLDATQKLKGRYAFIALNRDGSAYCVRGGSPLYIAKSSSAIIAASDPSCFAGKSSEYYALKDGELAAIKGDEAVFYDFNGNEIDKTPTALSKECEEYSEREGGYMIAEIFDQPEALTRVDEYYISRMRAIADDLKRARKVFLIGCGTAYHACLHGANVTSQYLETAVYAAGDFDAKKCVKSGDICFFVSQSGETADVLIAHDSAKKTGAKTYALTNVGYSSLASFADVVLPTLAGPERAVASTKAYTAQVRFFDLLSSALSGQNPPSRTVNPNKISERAVAVAQRLKDQSEAFILGMSKDYVTALEGALKVKEVTYLNVNGYLSSELKHGFIALIHPGSVAFCVMTDKEKSGKTVCAATESRSRGAYCVAVATDDALSKDKESEFDEVIKIDSEYEAVIFFQLTAYHLALLKGYDPDTPRNLAKSVTVE
jgi:glucosamine--fructose-6-phosphate aminotransferase (isomerizing)